MSDTNTYFILKKVFGIIAEHPWISLIVLIIIIILAIVFAKQAGDHFEGKYQTWVLWIGIGLVVMLITFFLLRLISAGKYLI